MNIVSIRRTVPITATIFDPLQVIVDLPGPYLMGISTWTSDALGISDITLRLVEPPASRLFPEPSATIRTPLTELAEDGWYHPSLTMGWCDLRLVVSGDPRHRVVLELVNGGQGNVIVIVNLRVATSPPDQTTLELLKEMNQGIERVCSAASSIKMEMAKVLLASRQEVPK